MRKKRGIILFVLSIVFIVLGTISRSLFYGITDVPYSVYGKFWTLMICFYFAAGISLGLGVYFLIRSKRK